MDRKTFRVSAAAVAPNILQSFDVREHLASEIALDLVLLFNHLSQALHIIIREFASAAPGVNL